MHALHSPHLLVSDGLSFGKGKLVYISPRKNHEPSLLLMISVFLPIQPSPAFSAKGFSITGALSTNGLCIKLPGTANSILLLNFFNRFRINLW